MSKYQVQEAKAHFSEVLERAENEGPQIITRYGEDYVAIIGIEVFREKFGTSESIVDFLLSGPKFDDFDVERNMELAHDEGLFDE